MCGEIGLSFSYLYSLTFNQINKILAGYEKTQTANQQLSWVQTRLIAFSAAHAFSDDKKAKPEKWMPFPWEKKELKKPKKTRAEREALFKKIDQQNNP